MSPCIWLNTGKAKSSWTCWRKWNRAVRKYSSSLLAVVYWFKFKSAFRFDSISVWISQIVSFRQQFVLRKLFDWMKCILWVLKCSMRAVRPLTLYITLPQRCSNHLVTPDPSSASSKPNRDVWCCVTCNYHNRTHCVTLSCLFAVSVLVSKRLGDMIGSGS